MHTPPPSNQTSNPHTQQTSGFLALAWLILDADALLVDASAAAVALLAANAEVLQLQGLRLQAMRQPTRWVQALAVARAQGRCALALPRGQRLPLTLLLQRHAVADGDAGWHISLRDPDAERPDAELVQALFGLTPCEAAVATALALGHSTDSIALGLGVQTNTVLSHIKKVLTKTGTQRQAQLVSLLLRSVAMVGPSPPPRPLGPCSSPAPWQTRPAVAGCQLQDRRKLAHPGNDSVGRPAHTANQSPAPNAIRQPSHPWLRDQRPTHNEGSA